MKTGHPGAMSGTKRYGNVFVGAGFTVIAIRELRGVDMILIITLFVIM